MGLQDDHTNPYPGYRPYSLVFWREAVQPLELQLPFLRIDIHESITKKANAEFQLLELEKLDETNLLPSKISSFADKECTSYLVLHVRSSIFIGKRKVNWKGIG